MLRSLRTTQGRTSLPRLPQCQPCSALFSLPKMVASSSAAVSESLSRPKTAFRFGTLSCTARPSKIPRESNKPISDGVSDDLTIMRGANVPNKRVPAARQSQESG